MQTSGTPQAVAREEARQRRRDRKRAQRQRGQEERARRAAEQRERRLAEDQRLRAEADRARSVLLERSAELREASGGSVPDCFAAVPDPRGPDRVAEPRTNRVRGHWSARIAPAGPATSWRGAGSGPGGWRLRSGRHPRRPGCPRTSRPVMTASAPPGRLRCRGGSGRTTAT